MGARFGGDDAAGLQGGHKARPYAATKVQLSALHMIDLPTNPRRRSLRLTGYDYAQAGAYFVTICTRDRVCLFGEVVEGSMRLNAAGELATKLWSDIPTRFPETDLDLFIVMPNHVHGITVLPERLVGAPLVGARSQKTAVPAVGTIVGAFKSIFALKYIRGVKENDWQPFHRSVWQRNYYEHVIRDEADLGRVRRYIDENPLRWDFDDENPQRVAAGRPQGPPLRSNV